MTAANRLGARWTYLLLALALAFTALHWLVIWGLDDKVRIAVSGLLIERRQMASTISLAAILLMAVAALRIRAMRRRIRAVYAETPDGGTAVSLEEVQDVELQLGVLVLLLMSGLFAATQVYVTGARFAQLVAYLLMTVSNLLLLWAILLTVTGALRLWHPPPGSRQTLDWLLYFPVLRRIHERMRLYDDD